MEKFKKIVKVCFESFLWIGVLLLIADFVSKQVVLHNMYVGQVINIIPGFCYIQYVVNDGMAFGMNFNITSANTDGADIVNRIIYIAISVIGAIIISCVYFINYKKLNKIYRASLSMMLAGCLGNLIDRAFYSESYLASNASNASGVTSYGVVDWIAFDFGSYQFPRFNIADASLVVGTIMLIVMLIVDEVKESKAAKANEPKVEGKILSKDEILMQESSKAVDAEIVEPAQEEPSNESPTSEENKES